MSKKEPSKKPYKPHWHKCQCGRRIRSDRCCIAGCSFTVGERRK